MNREIKFKYIWRRKEDGHFYVNISPIECLELHGDRPFVHIADLNIWEMVARCEYIGIKDKSGNDIFEDDILGGESHRIRMTDNRKVPGSEHFAAFQVLCVGSAWGTRRVKPQMGHPSKGVSVLAGLFEVIGNIHENRDLLIAPSTATTKDETSQTTEVNDISF